MTSFSAVSVCAVLANDFPPSCTVVLASEPTIELYRFGGDVLALADAVCAAASSAFCERAVVRSAMARDN